MIYEEDKQLVVNFMLRSTKLMHGHLPHVLTPAKEREREREREREGGGGGWKFPLIKMIIIVI